MRIRHRLRSAAAALHVRPDCYVMFHRFLQAIEYAIANKLARVEAGAQGEHKVLRGYQACTTYSAHYCKHPTLHEALREAMGREQEYVNDEVEVINEHMSAFKVAEDPAGATVSVDDVTSSTDEVTSSMDEGCKGETA